MTYFLPGVLQYENAIMLWPTLQLTEALKWGAVWTSSSTGTGIMKVDVEHLFSIK